MKVEVEELESLFGLEDSEVEFRRILEEARNQQGHLRLSAQRGGVNSW